MNKELIKKYVKQKWLYKRIYGKYSNYNETQKKIIRELEIYKFLKNLLIGSFVIELLYIVIYEYSLLKFIIIPLFLIGVIRNYQVFKDLNNMNKLFEDLENEKEKQAEIP